MEKILILEDDISLVEGLTYMLIRNGYKIDVARTLKEAKEIYQEGGYQIVLLDVTLPDGSGFDLCEWIRRTSAVPIIFLTASDSELHIVRGLDMGGDDYIIKPFKLNELLSRIKALLRRSYAFRQNETMLTAGDLCIDIMQNRVTKAGIELELTAGEYRLLCYFVRNKGVLLSREKIEDTLWDQKGAYVDDNTLSVYIRRLRNKLETDPSHPQLLQTVRGIGYRFVSAAD